MVWPYTFENHKNLCIYIKGNVCFCFLISLLFLKISFELESPWVTKEEMDPRILCLRVAYL